METGTSATRKQYHLHLIPEDNQRLANLCGHFDENIKQIEKQLHVTIGNQGHQFNITGDESCAEMAKEVLFKLYI